MSIEATTQKQYVVTATTKPLKDGQARQITLVGLVETISGVTPLTDTKKKVVGKKTITTVTEEQVPYAYTTLRIGLAVLSPLDASTGTPERGIEIAKGKASKESSALATIETFSDIFGKSVVLAILQQKAKHITNDPDHFVKVNVPKPKKEAPVAETGAAVATLVPPTPVTPAVAEAPVTA